MRPRRLAVLATPIVVLAGSQVGHLLTSELRQGPYALAPDHSGVHAYVPALSTVAFGAVGAAILAALMVLAVARASWAGPLVAVRRPRRSVLDLVAVLFALQLAVYLIQETVEAVVGGSRLLSAADLLLWGSLGQLPVAFLAALLLGWIEAQLEMAIVEMAAAQGRALGAHPALLLALPRRQQRSPRPARPAVDAASERGPPYPLLRHDPES